MSWIGSTLLCLGLLICGFTVLGLLRLPDVYLRIQAASKAAAFGVIAVLLASVGTGDGTLITRAFLVGIFLLLSSPVSGHAIAQAAMLSKRRLRSTAPWDETGMLAPKVDDGGIRPR